VDVAALAVRYADTLGTSAALLTPHVVADWDVGSLDASATYSQFSAGGWSGQGALSASRFTPTLRNFYGELAGFAGGSSHNDGNRTGEIVANGRLHFPRPSGEMFFGAGVGRTWDGIVGRRLVLGEAGLAFGSEVRNALVTINPAIVNSSTYADAQGTLAWTTRGTRLGALVGFRLGDQAGALGSKTKSWASLSALTNVRERLAIVASGGSYPIDPTQGFPGGKFLSLGVRVSGQRRPSRAVPVEAREEQGDLDPPVPAVAVLAGFQAITLGSDSVTLRIHAPGAKLVEINGDFTSWSPVRLNELAGEAGWWSTTLPLTAGEYQMNVRLDGGGWMVPPGMLSMRDEFGGAVGLLVVH
jgi:hypothetical protein